MAPELILHHYDFSCFSEKVRLVLGMKGLRWRSVSIPPTLPKPDYMPLTGGYRRAPALQIGADVFCDSVRIVEELEERFPEPSVYPGPNHREQWAFAAALQGWTDSTLLRCTINYISCLHADAPRFTPEFLTDRAALFGKSVVGLKGRETAMEYLAQLRPQLEWIRDVLSDGRPYIAGETMSLADCAVYHALWIMDQLAYERVSSIPPPIRSWMDRIAVRGHGSPSPMSALEALAVAAATDPKQYVTASAKNRHNHVLLRGAPLGAGRGLLVPAAQIFAGGHIIDAQLRRQRRYAHAKDDSKVDRLGLPPGAAETLHDQVVIIPAILESGDHLGIAGARRKNAQLELGIVGVDEDAALGGMEETTEFRVGQDVLQIRIGTGVTPGDRPAGVQLTMQPPVDDVTGERRAERRQAAHLLGPRIKRLNQSPLGRLQTIGNENRREVLTTER